MEMGNGQGRNNNPTMELSEIQDNRLGNGISIEKEKVMNEHIVRQQIVDAYNLWVGFNIPSAHNVAQFILDNYYYPEKKKLEALEESSRFIIISTDHGYEIRERSIYDLPIYNKVFHTVATQQEALIGFLSLNATNPGIEDVA